MKSLWFICRCSK